MIVQTQIGVGILSLPYDLHQAAKQDGWISLILGGLFLIIILFILWLIAKSYPDQNFYQINNKIFSKWLGKVVSFFYILYFTSVSTLIILLFSRMISLWVLPSTPFWVLAILMVFVGFYLANAGLVIIARFYTMVSFLLLLLVVLTIYSMKDIQLMYLFPVGQSGWDKISKGVLEAILAFFGFFVSLVIFSRVEGSAKAKFKTMLAAHFFVLSFYLYTVFISYTFFGTKEMGLVPEPLLYMLKSFELPLVARIDLFFISIWIVSVATSFTTYIYIASLGLRNIFETKNIRLMNLIICIVSYSAALFIGLDMAKVDKYSNFVIKTGLIFSMVIPFAMLLISAIVRKVKKGKKQS